MPRGESPSAIWNLYKNCQIHAEAEFGIKFKEAKILL